MLFSAVLVVIVLQFGLRERERCILLLVIENDEMRERGREGERAAEIFF